MVSFNSSQAWASVGKCGQGWRLAQRIRHGSKQHPLYGTGTPGQGAGIEPLSLLGDGRSLDTRSPDGMRPEGKIVECVTTVRREMSADNKDRVHTQMRW
jgi:hypothetical protein